MSRYATPVVFSRIILMMLALSLCLQPVSAANCDVNDVRIALDGGEATDDAAPDVDGDLGDCCASTACVDCCLHVTALPSDASLSLALPELVCSDRFVLADFRPSDYPVNIRPPITG